MTVRRGTLPEGIDATPPSVGPPRNHAAYWDAQAIRCQIYVILKNHSQAAKPLSAKDIQPRLSRRVSIRTIQWHMQQIRATAQ